MVLFDVRDHVNKNHPGPGSGRSKGFHVSNLVESIATTLGHLDPQDWDTTSTLRVSIGQSWEDYLGPKLEKSIKGFVHQPGEYELDGIFGTPDGEELTSESPSGLRLHEIKATWISVKNKKHGKNPGLIPWYWKAQIMAYCKMLGTTEAVLHRLYLNGSYGPPSPYYWPLGLRFTQEELDRHWRMLVRERDRMAALGLEGS